MKEKIDQIVNGGKQKQQMQKAWIALLVVFVFLGIGITGLVAYANSYPNRVLPGLHLGEVPIGGMERDELKRFLQDMNDKLVAEGFTFLIDTGKGSTDEFIFYPVVVTETNSVELLVIDTQAELDRLVGYGKQGNVFTRAGQVLRSRVQRPELSLAHIASADERILETLGDYLSQFETPAVSADVIIDDLTPLTYHVSSSTPGIAYDTSTVIDQLIAAWSILEAPQVTLAPDVDEPGVSEEEVQTVITQVKHLLIDKDITLTHTNAAKRNYSWDITAKEVSEWIEIQKDEEEVVQLGLNKENVQAYIEKEIAPVVTVEARDAKFKIGPSGRVVEFQGSRPGVTVEVDETYEAINGTVAARGNGQMNLDVDIELPITEVEPIVPTGEINDLGITEVLGTGVSSYAGSPANRIKNIRHAVRKLHGVMIKPGEDFSTIEHTQPYTVEGGYLPELVIKGDEIKPEIGGGLCQIGTTLFRMAMNSALPITQRRNHSLVVNYYNDPANGLPGTDATIYDPAPDFRFNNDTGNHILVQTYMDEATQELRFTLWGTSDGRQGNYTAPVVTRWIEHGETRIVETTKLAPGVRECQNAYRGADASFTYSRTLADGTSESRVFESHYRPLPQICLVGVEPEKAACEDGTNDCLYNPDGTLKDILIERDEETEQLLSDLSQDGLIVVE